jgi:hypothetical protein
MTQTVHLQTARLFDGLARQKAMVPRLGERADWDIVIDGDPLRDVRELRKLTTVYRGGIAHDPQAILANVPKSDFVPLS